MEKGRKKDTININERQTLNKSHFLHILLAQCALPLTCLPVSQSTVHFFQGIKNFQALVPIFSIKNNRLSEP